MLSDVYVRVDSGRITLVSTQRPEGSVQRLDGLIVPGFANAHSHAFHRALRGRTHDGGGSFWTWREAMYEVAHVLDPDLYHDLARATFAEMAQAGITSVGEFHYLHHRPDGSPYADPNAMATALREAAREAGLRLTLLDTCYLAGGLTGAGPEPLRPEQQAFSDGTVQGWAQRAAGLSADEHTVIGAAIHSIRAVPRDAIPAIVEWATSVDPAGPRPLHTHLSEQPAENDACIAAYGLSPTQVLHDAGALGPRTTVVHATHLMSGDIELLGTTATTACFCPTTERDLADGIGPARGLLDAGAPLSLGSDQHAVIDPLEEMRALEMHERLLTLRRGRLSPTELLNAGTLSGHRSLGWPDAGSIAVGQRADLVCLDLDSVRTAGSLPAQAMLAATAADIRTVIRDGAVIVADGQHTRINVAQELNRAITEVWARVNSDQ